MLRSSHEGDAVPRRRIRRLLDVTHQAAAALWAKSDVYGCVVWLVDSERYCWTCWRRSRRRSWRWWCCSWFRAENSANFERLWRSTQSRWSSNRRRPSSSPHWYGTRHVASLLPSSAMSIFVCLSVCLLTSMVTHGCWNSVPISLTTAQRIKTVVQFPYMSLDITEILHDEFLDVWSISIWFLYVTAYVQISISYLKLRKLVRIAYIRR